MYVFMIVFDASYDIIRLFLFIYECLFHRYVFNCFPIFNTLLDKAYL